MFVSIFGDDVGSLLGSNQTLKSYGSKTMTFNSEMDMNVESATQSKMYKRSMFNISASLDGINGQFSSRYSANIIDVSITLNAEGITGGTHGDFQIDEFYTHIETFFSSSIITRILSPKDIILIGTTSNTDDNGQTTIVNDNGYVEKYINKSFNRSKSYRVYFPRVQRAGSGDGGEADDTEDIKDVINQSKLYSISISCQDKLYTVKATSLT